MLGDECRKLGDEGQMLGDEGQQQEGDCYHGDEDASWDPRIVGDGIT